MIGIYHEIMKKAGSKDIIELGGNAPVCPCCWNNNAMLGRICGDQGKLECRDCGFIILPEDGYTKRCFSLVKEGKGKVSEWSENY